MISRDDFGHKAGEMANGLALDMQEAMMKAYDKLTPDEIEKLGDDLKPYIFVRAMGMAIGPDALSQRFEVESSKPITRRIKTILNRRP